MHFLEDDPKPGSELAVERRADNPAIHKLEHAGHFAHHSPPRIPGAGVDADDGDGLRHEKKREEISAPRMETRQEAGRPHRKTPGRFHLERSNRALFCHNDRFWKGRENISKGKRFPSPLLSKQHGLNSLTTGP